ncbi:MAG TPA: 3-phosphoshikimate 1-carboxyvinyltransferase [Anaerolineales bacterium]
MKSPAREVLPISHSLDATVSMPGSKSLTNRALLLASLANGQTRLINALVSDDTLYFIQALQQLGFTIQLEDDRHEITVVGTGGVIPAEKAELFIGNAGTAARFLTAFLTLGCGTYILDGDDRMRERPITDLVSALQQLGANLQAGSGCPPVHINASGLAGGRARLAGNVSSQFLSALLMVGPYARRPVELELSTRLNSRPYVDLTLSAMHDFGIDIQRDGEERYVVQSARYQNRPSYEIEPDASAASYFFAAPAICGGAVRVKGLRHSCKQGDLGFLKVLQDMGCAVTQGLDYMEVSAGNALHGLDVDLSGMPDTAQTLAAIAPFAATPTRIRGIASARAKETDRVHATCSELARLGVHVEEHSDGMTIHPCQAICPASIQTYGDHRMAMAFSLIGLRVPGIRIQDPGCVSKTFPGYFGVLESLR